MFLIIDNYDSFTYNLVQAFHGLGREPVVLRNDDPKLLRLARDPALDMVCISPGPSHPGKAGLCLDFLRLLPTHIPVLGVCLGHQVLGLFAGARVDVAPRIMHGKQSEIVHDGTGLFTGLPNPMTVGRYHSLLVYTDSATDNAMGSADENGFLFTVTARGSEGEVMALRYNDRPWVGVQFHPESVLTPEGPRLLDNFPQAIGGASGEAADFSAVLDRLAKSEDLTAEMAATAFAALMDGRMTDAQAGSFLMGLRMKGESALELAHATRAALSRSVRVEGVSGPCIDIVGTGGDKRYSFNCSTATSLTLAGMGHKVIKHGNRAVSSKCGSADALEALGVPLDVDAAAVANMMEQRGFAFLFAPHFHPAFKNIGALRRELGIRTLFNILGPMINPARPSHLLMGVAKPELVPLITQTLAQSPLYRAAVVCGAGDYDEVTAFGPAEIMLLHSGEARPLKLDPADYGVMPCTPEDLAVRSKEEAVAVLKELLNGDGPRPMREMIMLNVGLALYLLEESPDMGLCMARAREAVAAGIGRRVLHAA